MVSDSIDGSNDRQRMSALCKQIQNIDDHTPRTVRGILARARPYLMCVSYEEFESEWPYNKPPTFFVTIAALVWVRNELEPTMCQFNVTTTRHADAMHALVGTHRESAVTAPRLCVA